MIDFEKISLTQIIAFSEVVKASSLKEKEFVEAGYKKIAANYDTTITFLTEIGLLVMRGDKIILHDSYISCLAKWQQSNGVLQNYIVRKFIGPKHSFSEYLIDFFALFRNVGDSYEFKPTISQRLKYSGLRNLLMELEVLRLDKNKKKYVVAKDYFRLFARLNKYNHLSIDGYLENLKNKELIGNLAEMEILKYEKARLANFPQLVKAIEHISRLNVAAGYDIKSYEDVFDKHEKPILRYIEVKAVSPWNFRFYWTRNEIEKAESYRSNYYLYLVPLISKNKCDMKSLKIIRDPYLHIYKKTKAWPRRIELMTFSQ